MKKHLLLLLLSYFLLAPSTLTSMPSAPPNFGAHPFTPNMAAAMFPLSIYPIFYTITEGKIRRAEIIPCTVTISDEMRSIIANGHPPDEFTCNDMWLIIFEPFLLNATKRSVPRTQRSFSAVQLAFVAWIHGTYLNIEQENEPSPFRDHLPDKPLWEKLTETGGPSLEDALQFVEWLVAKVYNLGLFEADLSPLPSSKGKSELYRMPDAIS